MAETHSRPAGAARPGQRPSYPQRVLALLDGSAGLDRDRPVFEHGDRVVTASEMLDLVHRISTGLRDAGLGPGDGVAVHLGVTPEAFAAGIAAHVVGARVVGVRPGLTRGQLAHLLHQDVRAVLVDAATVSATVRDAAAGARLLAVAPVEGLADLTATRPGPGPVECTARPDDVARVLFTSGSTGVPKGCTQTYAGLAAGWAANPAAWPPVIRELAAGLRRYLVFGSLSSQVMVEYGVLSLAAGGTLVVADPPFAFPEVVPRLGASASVITVPKLYRAVAAQRETPADLSTLRALMVSGSPLDPGRLAEALDVLGPVVFHGYGQTETGMISMIAPSELIAAPEALASVGTPPAVIAAELRGPDGELVPDGAVGELYVRTPPQATGYLDDPAGTAEVFVDGWVRTRDLARRDSSGRLQLVGRSRDVVIVDAVLVHPGPVERALATHPDVAEAYVVGAPSEASGEAVHAFVVLTAGRVPDARVPDAALPGELRELVRAELGAAAVPATVTVIDGVPIAPSGKPDKSALLPLLPPGADSTRGGGIPIRRRTRCCATSRSN